MPRAPSFSDTTDGDRRLRLVSIALEPALLLARSVGLSLDDLLRTVSVSYFKSYQQRGLSFTAIARRLGKSRRTVASLANLAKTPEPAHESDGLSVQRRILLYLAAKGPQTAPALKRRFAKLPAPLYERALEAARDAQIIAISDGKYWVTAQFMSMVSSDFERRLASLEQFMQAIANGVHQRFFPHQGRVESFARVLSFRSSAPTLERIRRDCYEELRSAVLAANAECDGASDAMDALACSVALVFTEEPREPPL